VERARAWFRAEGPARGLPLELDGRADFQLLERTLQPTLPEPLPPDFADFAAGPALVPRGLPRVDEVTPEGHEKQGFPARRLRTVSG
jgi:hypothetical protein